MVEIIWTKPALADLDATADYIALENQVAAAELVSLVFAHVGQLADHPRSGSKPLELDRATRYQQIIKPPCRVFYRSDKERIFVLHVICSERLLRPGRLSRRAKSSKS